MTTDQFLVAAIGFVLVVLAIMEVWKPALKQAL